MYAFFTYLDGRLAAAEKFIIQVCTACIALIMTAQVIFRYALSAPLYWAEEVCIILMINLTFFGLSLLVNRRTLVAVNLLPNLVSPKIQKKVALVVAIIIMVVLAILSYHAIEWLLDPLTHSEKAETTGIPKWTLYMIMPVAMVCMTFHYVVYLMEFIWGRPGGER